MIAVKLDYIWFGAKNEIRSKVRVEWIDSELNELYKGSLNAMPTWNYDGSSTNQASGDDSEVLIKPVKVYPSPFENDVKEYIVLCETYLPNGQPHPTNNRSKVRHIFTNDNINNYHPRFGIEHEFFVLDNQTKNPLGFKKINSTLFRQDLPFNNSPNGIVQYEPENPQGQYYCSVGSNNAYGRQFLQECLNKAINCGVKVTGSNMEVAPGQMEIQVCNDGIDAADDSSILKYILSRVGESYDYIIDWSAKPVKGDWNGSGCHVNFSTSQMREEGGIENIMEAINRLSGLHREHIQVYGEDNSDRLTGLHETSDINTFSYGVANRGCSIRIPRSTQERGCGYFEDRRPSSSADMYLVTGKIFETCSLLE